jgi:hypothetical protein
MRTPTPSRSERLHLFRSFALAASILAAVFAIALAPRAEAQESVFPTASAPAPELTAQPDSPDNDLAPRWTFSGPEDATFECSLARGETLVGDWAPCVSPAVYDLSSEPDGVYAFSVRARTADGAVSDPASSEYTLDTTIPPLPTIVTLPGPAAADRAPEWTFSGGVNERFECRLDRGSKTVDPWSECSSPKSFDLAGEPDGSYLFSVRGVGEGDLRSPARTDGYLLDTRAPAAPEISSAPPPLGNATSPALAFSAENGARVDCRVSGGGADSGWEPCESPWSPDLGGRPDGTYALALRATDSAGNTGPVRSSDYTLDTTPPAPPAVEAPTVSPAARLQPSFRFATEPGSSHECRLDGPGGYATGWEPCTSPAPYDLVGQPDGDYAFAVRATDSAGNSGEPGVAGYELRRDPEAVDLQSSPGPIGRDRRPRWSFEATEGARFVCSLDLEGAIVFKPAVCGSPRTYDLSYRPDGRYSFTVQAFDEDGAPQQPATQHYELDSTAPALPEVEASPVSPAPDRTPAWRFAGEDGAALDCRVARGQQTVVDWTPCTNPKPFDLGNGADGDYRVSVRARDAAGNVGQTATAEYDLDSTPPAPPSVTAAPKAQDIDRSPTWKFASESQAVATCTLRNGADVVAPKSPCAGTKTYNLSGAQPGTYTFVVEATDAAGNRSRARTAQYVLAAAPRLALDPAGGSGSGTGGGGSGGGGGPGGGATDPGTGSPGTGSPGANGGAAPPRATGSARTFRSSSGAPAGSLPSADPAGPGTDPGSAAPSTDGSAGSPAAAGQPDASGGDDPPSGRSVGEALADAVGGVGRGAAEALTGDAARTVFPVSLLVILAIFLLVQGRIDRGDPKLALAPLDREDDLEFRPPPR